MEKSTVIASFGIEKAVGGIPARQGGGGGGRPASPELEQVRKMATDEKVVLKINPKPDEAFEDAARRATAKFHRKGALSFGIAIRSDAKAGTVTIYRKPDAPAPAAQPTENAPAN